MFFFFFMFIFGKQKNVMLIFFMLKHDAFPKESLNLMSEIIIWCFFKKITIVYVVLKGENKMNNSKCVCLFCFFLQELLFQDWFFFFKTRKLINPLVGEILTWRVYQSIGRRYFWILHFNSYVHKVVLNRSKLNFFWEDLYNLCKHFLLYKQF